MMMPRNNWILGITMLISSPQNICITNSTMCNIHPNIVTLTHPAAKFIRCQNTRRITRSPSRQFSFALSKNLLGNFSCIMILNLSRQNNALVSYKLTVYVRCSNNISLNCQLERLHMAEIFGTLEVWLALDHGTFK